MNITKQLLEQKYITEELSTRDCAKFFGVGQTTIRRYLKQYGISSRTSKEGKNTKSYKNKEKEISNKISNSIKNFYREEKHLITKICPICGKSFETTASQNKMYCSEQCVAIHRSQKRSKNKSRKLVKNEETGQLEHINICKVCQKEFKSEKIVKFCSDECAKEFHKQQGQKLKIRKQVHCAECGTSLYRIPSAIKFLNFCNVECMSDYYSKSGMWAGENSPTWKGGDTKHYKGHWNYQRKLARERDNYTCQLCGVTESEWHKELDVHHIELYRNFENPEEANALDNLVCLCNKCHSFVHSNNNIDKKFIK